MLGRIIYKRQRKMIFKYLNSQLRFDKPHIGKITNKKRAIILLFFNVEIYNTITRVKGLNPTNGLATTCVKTPALWFVLAVACTKIDARFFLIPTNLTICGVPQNAGSTSLLVFMSAIGVVLNVDRQSRKLKS